MILDNDGQPIDGYARCVVRLDESGHDTPVTSQGDPTPARPTQPDPPVQPTGGLRELQARAARTPHVRKPAEAGTVSEPAEAEITPASAASEAADDIASSASPKVAEAVSPAEAVPPEPVPAAERREAADGPQQTAAEPPAHTGAGHGADSVEPPPTGHDLLSPDGSDELVGALIALREVVVTTRYALRVPSAEPAIRFAAGIAGQFDDYLLPRLASLDAPVLVVVGGSTGAGKSTLVNSLVRAPVSPAGVLRPTTRAAVLVCHPDDASWFTDKHLLPGLGRTAVTPGDVNTLRVVSAPALPPGLAFLDAPDIDSVVDANRALAQKLLAAADMWLFVTSASRYADAVPWEQLSAARWRGAAIALVLDRVPPGGAGEILPHLNVLLAAHDLAGTLVFVLPEAQLDGQGLLSEAQIAPVQDWFANLAGSEAGRADVVRATLEGVIVSSGMAVARLAAAADEQVAAAEALDAAASLAYRTARSTVERGVSDGTLLHGEVLPRWRTLTRADGRWSPFGFLRDWIAPARTSRTEADDRVPAALEGGLVALVCGAATEAAEQATDAWRLHPAGAALLDVSGQQDNGRPIDLCAPALEFATQARQLIREWRQRVLGSLPDHDDALRVLIGACADSAGGATEPAEAARRELLEGVGALLDAEAARFRTLLDDVGVDATMGERLHRAAAAVETARRGLPTVGLTVCDSMQP